MSPPRTKCKKRKYRTSLDAKIALASTQRAKSNMRDECRVYYHPVCRSYHLSSLKKETT